MNVDNYGWESSLSMVANEQTRTARPRHGVTLLRPVFMNAVEVGYSYAHCDRDKKLNVRGVTIALWHFICRGHQAIALLPYCFKNYAEKSSRYSELMMLYRLNLIEFTPGYGSEKYAEVNRIMVNRACETGGCLVARSQMQGITDNKQHLIDVVEQRLLMPTFNGDDVMFPIDGPLGRNGPSLQQTLECEQGSPDWRSCSEHQLLLSDQRHWLEKLALLVPEKVAWTRMVQVIQSGGSTDPMAIGGSSAAAAADAMLMFGSPTDPPSSPPPDLQRMLNNNNNNNNNLTLMDNPFSRSSPTTTTATAAPRSSGSNSYTLNSTDSPPMPPSPSPPPPPLPMLPTFPMTPPPPPLPPLSGWSHRPIPNPHQMSLLQRSPSSSTTSSRRYPRHHHHHHHHHYTGGGGGGGGGRHHSTPRLILRYGPSGGGATNDAATPPHPHPHRSKNSAPTDSVESTASTRSGDGGGGVGGDEELQTSSPSSAIDVDEDVARSLTEQLEREDRIEEARRSKKEAKQKKRDELLAKVSQIFGYPKSIRVMNKYPELHSFCMLVEKCIQEVDEEGDAREFSDVLVDEPEQREQQQQQQHGLGEPEDATFVDDLIDFSDERVLSEPPTHELIAEPDTEPRGDEYSTNEMMSLVDLMS